MTCTSQAPQVGHVAEGDGARPCCPLGQVRPGRPRSLFMLMLSSRWCRLGLLALLHRLLLHQRPQQADQLAADGLRAGRRPQPALEHGQHRAELVGLPELLGGQGLRALGQPLRQAVPFEWTLLG